MLVVTSRQMSDIEKKAFEKGCSDDSFMILAGSNIAKVLQTKAKNKKIILLCGKGNNGGDAYVAGAALLKAGFTVLAYHFAEVEDSSKLNQKYFKIFQDSGGKVDFVNDVNELSFSKNAVVVDALLGTGFKGSLDEPYLSIVEKVNASNVKVFSIDIPSGVDGTTGVVQTNAIKADMTIYLGLLKAGFFLNDGPNYIGELVHVDFGLPKEFVDQVDPFAYYFQKENVTLAAIHKKRHKYDVGYVLGVAGSYGMVGAAMLSALASLKAGAGIVRLYSVGEYVETDSKPLEVIHQWLTKSNFSSFFEELKRAAAIFIGPGMGRNADSETLFLKIIKEIKIPVVLDADALFFLAKNPDIELPQDTILTPHHGEMLKILNEDKLDDITLIEKTITYAKKKRVIIVLKGAPTFVVHYEKKPFVIASGTPALATAGTGDVLTGIIAAQMAQKITPFQAAAQSAFLHGRAAQIAEKKISTYSLVASDVIEHLSSAFNEIVRTFGRLKTNQ